MPALAHGGLLLPFALILFIAGFDLSAEDRLSLSVLYLLPVAMIAASSTRRAAASAAVFAAGVGFAVDMAASRAVSLVDVWNLGACAAVYAIVATLVFRLARSAEHERELARTDFLTGVMNSRAFYDVASARLEAPAGQLTLMYVDIDDFKEVNDARGHMCGDNVLRQVGNALRRTVGDKAVVGRIGGDEFAIVCVHDDGVDPHEDVRRVTDQLAEEFAAVVPPVTFSAGAVTFLDSPAGLDEAIAVADNLMYVVKRAGKASYIHRVVGDSAVKRAAITVVGAAHPSRRPARAAMAYDREMFGVGTSSPN